MNRMEKYFPWLILGLTVLYLGNSVRPRSSAKDEFNLYGFAILPVQQGGRIQPMDTFARNTLMQVSNRQTFKDVDSTYQPAVKWALDALSSEYAGSKLDIIQQEVFRIDNDQVLSFFRLAPRAGFRYSFEELWPKFKEFRNAMVLLDQRNSKLPVTDLGSLKMRDLGRRMDALLNLKAKVEPHVVPDPASGEWASLAKASETNPAFIAYETMLRAYARGRVDEFNTALAKYQDRLQETVPDLVKTARFETFFNHFGPFYHCLKLYLVVFLLTCCSWLGWWEPLLKAAFWVAVLTFAVHSWAILARMMIMGRPPVTNLYASAVFIGWGCVGLCLILEWLFHNSIPLAIAGFTGFFTLVIADNLISGDTMDVLLPVLDTNIWLATHVVIITIGYTATFIAGFIGAAFIIMGVFTPHLKSERITALSKMIYGVVCFATLLSFTGTVLGGIWADQSWGRFWGWDPKENGALLIVIWNALVLHARWAGMIKQRGLAVLAVGGNIVTAWSWFGTNMLPVGLHAYGRMEGALAWLIFFIVTQMLVMAAGMLPFNYWYSFAPKTPPSPPLAGGGEKRTVRGDLRSGIKPGVATSGPSTGIRPGVARV